MINSGKQRHAWASRGKLGQVGASRGRLGLVGAGRGKLGQVGASLNLHNAAIFLSPLCFVHYLCKWNKLCESLRCPTWTKRVRLTGRKLMAHHQNQNGFTWKKTKQTACITVQYRCVITMDFKVNAASGNMWAPSTVGSFSLTKDPTFQVPKNLPMMIHRVKSQNNQPEYCLHFQLPAKLANYSRNGWLEVVGVARKIVKLSR